MTKADAGAADQAERSRRWRAGVASRLEEIRAELEALGARIEQQMAVMTDQLAEPSRRDGRAQ